PTADRLGINHVAIQVSDGRGGIATQTYDLSVQQQPGNLPPLITSQPVTSAVLGLPYVYQVQAQDADNDPLTFSLTAGPDGMAIDPITGKLTWQPGNDASSSAAGPHDVTVRVDDGRGGFDTQTFTLTVPAIPLFGGHSAAGEIDGTVYNDANGNGAHEVAGPLFLGPLPYLGKADSPFDLSGLGKTFFVDDFEHEEQAFDSQGPTNIPSHTLTQVPGVTVLSSSIPGNPFAEVISNDNYFPPLVDSVDED